jgi:DNA-directed RNA polymerase subunit RPC12/RpoP
MTNENCLEGIRCPKCGNEDRLFIVATILADVTDDGADIARHTDMEWANSSPARCPDCGETGPLSNFHTEE